MSPDTRNPEQHKRNLDVKFVGGLAWTAGAKWATQFLTWASLLIVARLLSPADFGLGEMAGLYFILTNVLAEFGIGTAVLHMPELTRNALAQLHMFSCLLCSVLFGLALLGTPWVAAFFRSSDHVPFFMFGNLALLITGVQAVPMGLLQRDMDYRRLSLAEALSVLAQSVVTVTTAWWGWGAWALMIGGAAGKVTAAVLVCSWKHVGFAWPRWKEIRAPIELGRQIAVGRLAWAAYTQADGIVIGRVLGGAVLGTYKMAMNAASAPADKISTLIMRTASPLFANVMNDRPLVRRYYLIMVELLSLVVMPLMLGLAMVAPVAVPIVLGPKWAPAIAPLRWLSIFMIFRTMGILTEQVLVSQLLTRFTMRMSILNLVVMPIAFIVTAEWLGPGGVASAWLMLAPVTILPLLFVLLRKIDLPWRQYMGALAPAMTGSAAMCLTLAGLSRWPRLASLPPWTTLVLMIAAGGTVYIAVVFGLFRESVVRYLRFLRDMRKNREKEPAALLG